MKVTFPHMGKMYISVATMLEELGFEVIVPPPITNKTLDLGVKYSPEYACLPLKLNLGNYIEALEKGADVIIMGGGVGPCRFGYYGKVQEEILKDLGYEFEMVIIEPEQLKFENLFNTLKQLVKNVDVLKLSSALKKAWAKAKVLDSFNQQVNKTRPYLQDRKQGSVINKKLINEVTKAKEITQIKAIAKKYEKKLEELEKRKNFKPLKIGIVGEIYVVLEQFTNLDLEKKLGEQGVLVDKSVYLTKWIREHLFPKILVDNQKKKEVKKAAKPYLNHFVGGHGQESVGETVLYNQKGYDGVIQLFPFTCMPEIIAENVFPALSKELDLPILTLSIDEHTGEAGYVTRIEAFIDLLKRRQESEVII